MKSKKYIISVLFFGIIWLGLITGNLLTPAKEISDSERRKLANLPALTLETIISGDFMSDFEQYTLDQFILRDKFKTMKAGAALNLFMQKDNNGVYLSDGYAAKLDYSVNEKSITNAIKKLNNIYEMYLEDKNNKIYLSVIPDKGYYIGEKNGYPIMDYDKLFNLMRNGMSFSEYIDITGSLSEESYYRTDTHWRQEKLYGTVKLIAEKMGAADGISYNMDIINAKHDFYGVYYGQSALPLPGEDLIYLTNQVLEDCVVTNIENGFITKIYDTNKLNSRDPYEVFLSGAAPVLYIDNPNATTDKELVVFRDSFASSIIPLLTQGYSRVTLIDTRYIPSEYIGKFVEF